MLKRRANFIPKNDDWLGRGSFLNLNKNLYYNYHNSKCVYI